MLQIYRAVIAENVVYCSKCYKCYTQKSKPQQYQFCNINTLKYSIHFDKEKKEKKNCILHLHLYIAFHWCLHWTPFSIQHYFRIAFDGQTNWQKTKKRIENKFIAWLKITSIQPYSGHWSIWPWINNNITADCCWT